MRAVKPLEFVFLALLLVGGFSGATLLFGPGEKSVPVAFWFEKYAWYFFWPSATGLVLMALVAAWNAANGKPLTELFDVNDFRDG